MDERGPRIVCSDSVIGRPMGLCGFVWIDTDGYAVVKGAKPFTGPNGELYRWNGKDWDVVAEGSNG